MAVGVLMDMEVSQSDRVTGIPSVLEKGACHCDKTYFYSTKHA